MEMKRNEQIQVIFWRWRHEDWLMDRNEGKRGIKDKYVSIYEICMNALQFYINYFAVHGNYSGLYLKATGNNTTMNILVCVF